MRPLTEQHIRDSIVNASRADIERMPIPGLHEMVWEDREFLGWRDPEGSGRGYLVFWRGDEPVGLLLRAAQTRMSRGISAICSLCHTPQSGDQITLFTAPKAGQAGLDGSTVGTYICSDLACSIIIRIVPPRSSVIEPDADEVIARRSSGLTSRLESFTAEVMKTAA